MEEDVLINQEHSTAITVFARVLGQELIATNVIKQRFLFKTNIFSDKGNSGLNSQYNNYQNGYQNNYQNNYPYNNNNNNNNNGNHNYNYNNKNPYAPPSDPCNSSPCFNNAVIFLNF